MQESIDELLHRGPNGKAQVLAHLDAFRDGTSITHGALAKVFAPEGSLHQPLMDALQKQLPGAESAHIHNLTLAWLSDREEAAITSVQLIANDGEAYKQATAISKADHPVPAQPASHAERVLASKAAAADLVMNV